MNQKKKKGIKIEWREKFVFTKFNPKSDHLVIEVINKIGIFKKENLGILVIPIPKLNLTQQESRVINQSLEGSKGSLTIELNPVDFGGQHGSKRIIGETTTEIKEILESNSFDWHLPSDSIDTSKLREIGRGAFGVVYEGSIYGKRVAIKKLLVGISESVLEEFVQEVQILMKLRHPNVILFMGACIEPNHLAIVTEFLTNGSLEDLLKKNSLSWIQKMSLAKGVVMGMSWLHSKNNIVHLDLKPANLLLDDNMNVKVADFGVSCLKSDLTKGDLVGTGPYMAPEILLGESFDEKADVYSYGIVLWQIYTSQLSPYQEDLRFIGQLIEHIAKNNQRPIMPTNIPNQLKNLIENCWRSNPNQRPSFQEILSQKLLEDITFTEVFGSRPSLEKECWSELCSEKIRENVPFTEFFLILKQKNQQVILSSQKECLEILLSNETSEVNCEKLSQIVKWFGTLNSYTLLSIESLLSSGYFFGMLSGGQSESLLEGKKEGTFLVRFSVTEVGSFAIAVNSSKGVEHFKIIKKSSELYMLGSNHFNSINDIIKNPPPTLPPLVFPCPGSPYRHIFSTEDMIVYNGFETCSSLEESKYSNPVNLN